MKGAKCSFGESIKTLPRRSNGGAAGAHRLPQLELELTSGNRFAILTVSDTEERHAWGCTGEGGGRGGATSAAPRRGSVGCAAPGVSQVVYLVGVLPQAMAHARGAPRAAAARRCYYF